MATLPPKRNPRMIRQALLDLIESDASSSEEFDAAMRWVLRQAARGEGRTRRWAITFLADRLEGRPSQAVEMSGELAGGEDQIGIAMAITRALQGDTDALTRALPQQVPANGANGTNGSRRA